MEYGNMSLKPYQPLIPHGKFNSKLVPGRNGKMRIHETDNRPIEGMISKIYPAKEAEEILSIRSEGVQDFDADGNPVMVDMQASTYETTKAKEDVETE